MKRTPLAGVLTRRVQPVEKKCFPRAEIPAVTKPPVSPLLFAFFRACRAIGRQAEPSHSRAKPLVVANLKPQMHTDNCWRSNQNLNFWIYVSSVLTCGLRVFPWAIFLPAALLPQTFLLCAKIRCNCCRKCCKILVVIAVVAIRRRPTYEKSEKELLPTSVMPAKTEPKETLQNHLNLRSSHES